MIEQTVNLTNNLPSKSLNAQLNDDIHSQTSPFHDIITKESEHQKTIVKQNENTTTSGIDVGTLSQIERDNFTFRTEFTETKRDTPLLSFKEQIKMYKEDQLLSKPGGDYYNLNNKKNVIDYDCDHSKLHVRIGKDLNDAKDNFINIFEDIGLGASMKYIDENGCIQEDKKVGFLGTIINFFHDIASGITLGKFDSENNNTPKNPLEATKHFFKKIFVDAVFKDIIVGIPRSAIHITENTAFAAINLLETIPDATIGNFKAGQVITTEIFDDAQVFVDFITDVMPMGEAGSRTHALAFNKGIMGLPILHNFSTPEKEKEDENWRYVRNTPFRKTIETMATLIPIRL